MGVFALGLHLGLLLGLLVGGLVSHRYGWRVAFLAAGLPGLVLAALTYLTVEEPARRHGGPHRRERPGAALLLATARAMWGEPALRHLTVGAALAGAIALALLNWLPTFLARSHGMPAGPSGVALALIVGLGVASGPGRGAGWPIACGRGTAGGCSGFLRSPWPGPPRSGWWSTSPRRRGSRWR